MSDLKDKILSTPNSPGVYLFKNSKNKAIYIGKAANLRNRLVSYLGRSDRRSEILMSQTTDIDTIITNSDTEALTLEESLIKLHKPKYNVRLKDDKKFPYLRLTVQDDFPRIFFTRDLTQDGSIIFGPYTNARALRQTRDALCRIFRIVSCSKDFSKSLSRACLEYSLGRCSAPCTGQIDKEAYRQFVNKAIKFLKGESDELVSAIERQMWKMAKIENFEAAAALRNQVLALRRISQRQQVVTSDGVARDIIGIVRSGYRCVACLFRIRGNRLVSKEIYNLQITPSDTEENITGAFIRLIYTHISFLPEEVVAAKEPWDWDVQSKWFSDKGYTVKINTAPKGSPGRLLKWAEKNAESELAGIVIKKKSPSSIIELKNILQLEKPPRWIEAFDISNLKEKFAVGASVAFIDGKPNKQRYRRYKIKRVTGQNDFAMIKEIVARRTEDLKTGKKLPDLFLIDGGKGQLSAALAATRQVDLAIPVLAIAKRSDELFYPDGRVISLPSLSRSVFLMKRLRDEAHRFVISYHRKIRGKSVTMSLLDDIRYIGKERKMNLLKHFGSIDAIKKASEEEIAKVPKVGKKIARIISEILHA